MNYDITIHTNPDARVWTDFFRKCNPDCNIPDDVMLGWFVNAMMAMRDFMNGSGLLNGDQAQFLFNQVKP